MTEALYRTLEAVVQDDLFPTVDLALREGRHIASDEPAEYGFIREAQPLLHRRSTQREHRKPMLSLEQLVAKHLHLGHAFEVGAVTDEAVQEAGEELHQPFTRWERLQEARRVDTLRDAIDDLEQRGPLVEAS